MAKGQDYKTWFTSGREANAPTIADYLSELGADGWEAVGVLPECGLKPSGMYDILMKRLMMS